MSNNTLVQLIYLALQNQNNTERANAQKQILDIRQSNFNQFFLQCTALLIDQKQSEFIRQSASTMLFSSVRAKHNNVYLWDLIPQGTRQLVKNQMLNTLVDPNIKIVKAGANVISHIAAIQIPRNQWLDLVDILAQNTGYNDVNVRRASIITIGNICQQLHESASTIEPRACQQFLGGIIIGLQEKSDASIIQVSIKALRNSISFLKPILGEESYRNQVFRIICEKISIADTDEINLPYQAMFQFCRTCYEYLNPYLQFISQLASTHLKQKNDRALQALQMLDTIGSQYIARIQDAEQRTNISKNKIQNYLLPLQDQLLSLVLNCLVIQNKEQLDFPQLRNTAAKTLSTFANAGNRQTIDMISNAAAACLQQEKPGRLQATAIFLSTLCQNPDKQYVIQIISNAFQHVLNLLNSNVDIVVLNTLNGLITISQFFPFIFYNHSNISTIVNKLFQLINPKKPQITTAIILIFKNMTQTIQSNCVFLTEPSILLTRIVNLYEQFLDNYQGQCKDYTQKSVLVIMNCLVKLKNRQVILFMLEFLMNKYHFFYQRQVVDQANRLSSLASLVHTCILALQNMIPREGLIQNLCNLIDKHLSFFGIQQQGLNIISAMAITFNRSFEAQTQKYWKYLDNGLQLISQPRTFKAALCCVGDFSRVYTQTFIGKQLSILDRLLVLIHEGFDRQIKMNILACIADLMLGLGQSGEPYIPRILEMIDICFQAVYDFSNNPNQREYAEDLKRALIDMYACISFSINGQRQRNKSQLLFNHFPFVATFVVKTCQRNQNPTIDYVKSCLYLIFDSATFYWQQGHHRNTFKNILESQQIRNLVKILENFKQRDDIRQLQALIQQKYDSS